MYKVFFDDRAVCFGEDFTAAFRNHKGLFYQLDNLRIVSCIVEQFAEQSQPWDLYLIHPNLDQLTSAFKACFVPIKAGGGLVFNHRGEFLAILRNGIWDLPKGKLEKGEDVKAAALREVEEETGLQGLVMVQPLISTYHTYKLKENFILKKTSWFELAYSGTDEPVLQEKEGITDCRWVKPGEARFIRDNSYKSILDVLSIRRVL